MADVFRFVNTDGWVTRLLTQGERNAVARWQLNGSYDFEFHNGHPTGYPIYIRPNGNRDNANLPKFDTLNHTAADYATIAGFANAQKLRQNPLTNPDRADILAVVGQNWATLVRMAQRWWTNTLPPPPVVVIAAPVTKACNQPDCAGRVPIYAHNARAMCDTCYIFQ